MGNVSKQIVFERTREVYSFMINNSKQRKEIIRYFSDVWTKQKVFNRKTSMIHKHRTIDNYIRKVNQSFFNFEQEVENEKGRTLARLDFLYNKTVTEKDYKAALAIIKEVGEIVGFKAPTKLDHTSGGQPIAPMEITVSSIEAKEALENLNKRHKAKE
jgi:hypothetical protein